MLLSSVVFPERSEGTRSTIGGLCFLVFSLGVLRREATPVLRASARQIAIIQGGGGVCGGGGRLLVSCLCVVRRVATPRKAERSEAFHDSKYLLSR